MSTSISKDDKQDAVSSRDIRAQKSSVKNINVELDTKLTESEIRYRRLFETAKDGILILDFKTGNILEANPFIVNIIDHPLAEVVNKKLWEIGLFSNKEESEHAFIELKKNGYIRFEDMPIKRRNGSIVEVEFISNVYLENENKVIQCNIRDITKRKNAENALIKSEQNLKEQNSNYSNLNKEYAVLNEELSLSINRIQHINNDLVISKNKAEESDQLKTAFLANMSHEIRTPMNAIVGFSEFLLQPELTKAEIDRFVHIIHKSSKQLLSIISDIIDISKIQAGQFSVESDTVDINKLMNELLFTYKKLVGNKKLILKLSSDRPNSLIQIETDGNRIKQIFNNLLNNAIKFSKTGEGKIEFGYKTKANFIEFYVKDQGIGITQTDQSRIFERFMQTKSIKGELNGGNGLGLSISKALVEKLGGTICVDSEPGVGSHFTFTIPYAEKN
jgi:PAS domain S-box-containing protein